MQKLDFILNEKMESIFCYVRIFLSGIVNLKKDIAKSCKKKKELNCLHLQVKCGTAAGVYALSRCNKHDFIVFRVGL